MNDSLRSNAKEIANAKILVVDDESSVRMIVEEALATEGYQVEYAESSAQARVILKAQPIDLVITDVRMPHETGVELLKFLKNNNPATPAIILMTGFSDIGSQEAYAFGAEALILKPIELDDLLTAVRQSCLPFADKWSEPAGDTGSLQVVDVAADQVQIGRGGLFIEWDTHFPSPADLVRLNLHFPKGTIEGVGVVRWIRPFPETGLPSGLGVEFSWLSDTSREFVAATILAARQLSYIPMGS